MLDRAVTRKESPIHVNAYMNFMKYLVIETLRSCKDVRISRFLKKMHCDECNKTPELPDEMPQTMNLKVSYLLPVTSIKSLLLEYNTSSLVI